MDVRDRLERLAEALCHPDGIDLEDWFAPDARLSLPSVGVERDLREVLGAGGPGADVLPLASCTVTVERAVRNVVMANWSATLRGGGGGEGSAVASLDRDGRVTHLRLDGALLVA